jgi:excisionase family DNA binding protein
MQKQTLSRLSEVMTAQEIAKYLNVKVQTVYRLARRREIPSYRVGGQWRFELENIKDWIEQEEK